MIPRRRDVDPKVVNAAMWQDRLAPTPTTEAALPVAVSLTPLAVEADSRAFRIAQSLAEAGFRSILIEGQASARRFWGQAIEVRSLSRATAPGQTSSPNRLVAALRQGKGGSVGELLLYAAYRGDDWWRHCYRPRRHLPTGMLYYIHSFELYRALHRFSIPSQAAVIYDAHDFYRGIVPSALQPVFDRRRRRPFLDRLENRVLESADAVVTVSDGVARLIEQVCGRRPVVIRNCHDDRHDRMPEVDLRAALRLSPDDRLCVVVGNHKPGMAVEVAIAALAQLPERFHLAFLGRGYEAVASRTETGWDRGALAFRLCRRAERGGSVDSERRFGSRPVRAVFRELSLRLAQWVLSGDCRRPAAGARQPSRDRSRA